MKHKSKMPSRIKMSDICTVKAHRHHLPKKSREPIPRYVGLRNTAKTKRIPLLSSTAESLTRVAVLTSSWTKIWRRRRAHWKPIWYLNSLKSERLIRTWLIRNGPPRTWTNLLIPAKNRESSRFWTRDSFLKSLKTSLKRSKIVLRMLGINPNRKILSIKVVTPQGKTKFNLPIWPATIL